MTTPANPLLTAEALLAPWATNKTTPETNRVDFNVTPGNLLAATRAIQAADWGYLAAITGIDPGAATGELETLYQFAAGPNIVTLRVRTPREQAALPSVTPVFVYADAFERELAEMFGITVEGTPDPRRLYLSDDWPANIYPLRKDFDPAHAPQPTDFPEAAACGPENSGKFIVPIGPQHPALKEPGHFEFTIEGETITHASVRLGYVHRGIEKAAEDRSWIQALYLVERVCGICSHHHALAYSLGVEKLANVTAPPRAQAIRGIIAHLELIHSHMLWLGVAAHEAGFDTLFMYSWRDREVVMNLLENLTGNRVNYSANVLGGVKFDINEKQAETVRQGMAELLQRTQHYVKIVTTDEAFLRRTRGLGRMDLAEAKRLGVVGPTARASGVACDIRAVAPYSAYADFPIKQMLATDGDLAARFAVRLDEMSEACRSVIEILDKLPTGELTVKFPRRIPAGETISRVEAPRGELFYFLKSNGGDKPERVKARTPSICNFASVIKLAPGHQLADMPMLLAGIDPCFSCNDR